VLIHFLRLGPVKAFCVKFLIPAGDVALLPLTYLSALWLKLVRRVGVYRMTASRALFNKVGVFPIRDHYYEPAFNPRHLRRPLSEDRFLPGIDLNVEGQLEVLARFDYADELDRLPRRAVETVKFYYDNPNFPPGDSEYLYSAIRLLKPRRILEIGSGFSTLMMLHAIAANAADSAACRCEVRCAEPYEMEWLEKLAGVEVIRQRVEELEAAMVERLEANDILFIDSSHIIRPQGDVLKVYLEFLPVLRPGVFVHIHDIFTPRDYPAEWVIDEVRLWNEQYLLEAFLTCNSRFKVIGALNFLSKHYPDRMAEKFPVFRERAGNCDPGSLWLESR
jgi:predicted O-methyltransferase YrrM